MLMSVNVSGGTTALSAQVAEEIRALLARKRRSGRWLAAALGASQTWMSSRLTGATPIDLNDLQRIAEALEVDVVELIARARIQSVVNSPVGNGKTTVPNVDQAVRPPLSGMPKRATPPASSRRPARLVPFTAELMPDTPMELLSA